MGTGRWWELPPVAAPDLVGLVVADARRAAQESGLWLAAPDPDGPPLIALTGGLAIRIRGRYPDPGTMLPVGSPITVTRDGPGGSMREPRRPRPRTVSDRAARSEPPAGSGGER